MEFNANFLQKPFLIYLNSISWKIYFNHVFNTKFSESLMSCNIILVIGCAKDGTYSDHV